MDEVDTIKPRYEILANGKYRLYFFLSEFVDLNPSPDIMERMENFCKTFYADLDKEMTNEINKEIIRSIMRKS